MDTLIKEVNADLDIKAEGETAYYQVFLLRTQDKVIEAMEKFMQDGSKGTKEYDAILEARAYARKQIEGEQK